MRHPNWLVGATWAVFLVVAAGCGGGSDGGSSPTSTTSQYAGAWRGTADGRDLSFTVTSAGEVTSVSVVRVWIYLTSAGGGAVIAHLCPVTMTSTASARINGTSFEATVTGGGVSSIVRGTFGSSTTASGQLDPFTITRGCSGETITGSGEQTSRTWQATRQ